MTMNSVAAHRPQPTVILSEAKNLSEDETNIQRWTPLRRPRPHPTVILSEAKDLSEGKTNK